MRRKSRKTTPKKPRRHTKSVNEFDTRVQQFEGALSAELRRFKGEHPKLRGVALERWVVRKLAGLSVLFARQAQKRDRRAS